MNEILNDTKVTLEKAETVRETEVQQHMEKLKDVRLNTHMKEYVNKVLRAFIAPFSDLKWIEYGHNSQTEQSVVMLQDAYGQSYFFDITGMDMENVGMAVAKFISGEKPNSLIIDRAGMKVAAALFH